MRAILFATALIFIPTAGFAQAVGGRIDTSAGRAASGPVDTSASSGINTRLPNRLIRPGTEEPPPAVRDYVDSLRGPRSGGSLAVGDALPDSTQLQSIPGYPQWGTAVVGGERVIVNRNTGVVSGVAR